MKHTRVVWFVAACKHGIPDGLTAFASCGTSGSVRYESKNNEWVADGQVGSYGLKPCYSASALTPDCIQGEGTPGEDLDCVIAWMNSVNAQITSGEMRKASSP